MLTELLPDVDDLLKYGVRWHACLCACKISSSGSCALSVRATCSWIEHCDTNKVKLCLALTLEHLWSYKSIHIASQGTTISIVETFPHLCFLHSFKWQLDAVILFDICSDWILHILQRPCTIEMFEICWLRVLHNDTMSHYCPGGPWDQQILHPYKNIGHLPLVACSTWLFLLGTMLFWKSSGVSTLLFL